jgi:periplasmic protein TonB
MNAHADILDAPDPLGKWLAGSVALHVSLAAALLGFNWLENRPRAQFGDINGGRAGSVAVNVVSQIPIPSRSGPVNPVANDTESVVPTPPPKAKPKPAVKPPEPDAIPIKSRNAPKRAAEAASERNKFREQQQDLPNQLYTSKQAAVSPQFGVVGGGGVGVGTNSPFGQQFGWYANLLRDKVARNWRTNELDPRMHSAPQVVVTFTIQRDGSVPVSSVRIAQRSGNAALDYSAQRAILDSAPFPGLPAQYPRNDADVEFVFELRR